MITSLLYKRLFISKVRIVEVGPRDGLQSEPFNPALTTNVKITLIKMLIEAGLKSVEAGSIVNPKRVPQMADTPAILSALFDQGLFKKERNNDSAMVSLPVLIPNRRGMELALSKGLNFLSEVSVFTAASETFNQNNINCSIKESLDQTRQIIKIAKENGIERVRGYISTVIGCPYEGWTSPDRVFNVAQELLDLGCYEISLGDTIGIGTPGHVEKLLDFLLIKKGMNAEKFAVHFHDTYGQALASVHAALKYKIKTVDSSIGGLGGCPFAPGATGNLATEDLVYMLHGMGIETGVDWKKLIDASRYINGIMKRDMVSRAANAWIQSEKRKEEREKEKEKEGKR